MKWPNKNKREGLEIEGFIEAYKRLPHGCNFIIEDDRKNPECPDMLVKDIDTNVKYGIELTSVYLDNRSVPDHHMKSGTIQVPFDKEMINKYEKRILEQIVDKVCKARKHYRKDYPLILSVYVNEYISLRMGIDYWKKFASKYNIIFDCFTPFNEIVFWPLPSPKGESDLVISARLPAKKI